MDILIDHLAEARDLTPGQVGEAARYLLDPAADDAVKERLLEALARKGETPAEIAAFVQAFLGHALDPRVEDLGLEGPTMDVCGTGGDQLDLFNVSTTAMFVAAAAGVIVVKHGNRGITSKSGGADVLEALGIRIDLPVEGFRRCLKEAGVGFMFAPHYHPAFKAVVGARKALAARGVRTLFNLIGPLLNPARPRCQLVGVFSSELGEAFATILDQLGRERAWVVHGRSADGRAVDEMSLMGMTRVCSIGGASGRQTFDIHPSSLGMDLVDVADLRGGDAATNAEILEAILTGRETGPKREMVMLNAAAALTCAGLVADLSVGLEMARDTIATGAAMERLNRLRKAASA